MHTNSGVLNHWYYLLVTGGDGVNDANIIPPSDLEAHATSATSVTLSWQDHTSHEAPFLIERSLNVNRGFVPVKAEPRRADYALDVRMLSPGIYTLVIQTDSNVSVTRRVQINR